MAQSGGDRPAPVSIRAVADRAGVSTATVSNVVHVRPSVAPHLVARVRAAIAELGYVGHHHASRLRSGKQALAGVVVPDLSNPMFGAFVSTLERSARRDGFDLLVVSSNNDPAEEAERLRSLCSWRPAGLIVIPCDGALAGRLPAGATVPVVVADRIPDSALFDLVAVDNARAASAVAAHLAAEGHRTCLVAGSALAVTNVRERWDGVRAGAAPMAVTMLECGFDPARIEARIDAALARRDRPDALFALDGVTALSAWRVLAARGLSVPGAVGFASFDEAEWMRLVTPAVTAVRQPVEAMAAAAWQELAGRMAGDAGASRVARLGCAIEIRGSSLRSGSRRRTAAA